MRRSRKRASFHLMVSVSVSRLSGEFPGKVCVFPQGNSNNIASVDISVGFVGLESYVEAPAIFLTALTTYAGPLLWACHLLYYLSTHSHRSALLLLLCHLSVDWLIHRGSCS